MKLRRILTRDLEQALVKTETGESKRIRAPKGSDVAITIFNGANKSGPTIATFSHQNIWSMMDSWLQAGIHSKAIASTFDNHTCGETVEVPRGAVTVDVFKT